MNKILRAPWHDYTRRCIYMVTLTKNPFVKDFGVLAGDWRIPAGQLGSSFVSTTPIGSAVKKNLAAVLLYRAQCTHIAICTNA